MPFFWDSVKEELFRFEHDTLVSASAGTGKTAALVELYMRILKAQTALGEGVGPDNILAITFTNKAATEMKERLRERLLQEKNKDPDDAESARLLERFSEAYIHTFHSFCSRLLRAHHFEAGLAPDFRMAEEAEQAQLKHLAAGKIVSAALASHDERILLMLRNHSYDNVLKELEKMSESTGILSGKKIEMADDPDLVQETITKNLESVVKLTEELERRVKVEKTTAAFDKACQKIFKHRGYFMARKNWPDIDMPYDRGMNFFAGDAGLATAFSNIKGTGPKDFKDLVGRIKSCIKEAQSAFRNYHGGREAQAAYDLTQEVYLEYKETKRRAGVLDYDDLQDMAIDLLASNKKVRAQWRERFDAILVDEFQDSNGQQLELIKLLTRPVEESAAGKHATRLLFVGDRKQSIYRFRGADVSIFGAMERKWKDQSDGGMLHFKTNYRSREHLLGFFNGVFAKLLLGSGEKDYEANYDEGDDLVGPGQTAVTSPPVLIYDVDKKSLGGKAECRRAEAAFLASWMQEAVEGQGEALVSEKDGRMCRAAYEDMAVLLRTRTHLWAYEQAFHKAGIPFTVVKGGGLFERPEVLDLMAVGRYLMAPHDLIALLTILRSPAVHLSDGGLYRLFEQARKSSLDIASLLLDSERAQELSKLAELGEEEGARLLHAASLLKDIRSRLGLLPASELFEELCERLDYYAVAACAVDSRRTLANQQKFLRLVRQIERRIKNSSLAAVFMELKNMTELDKGEGEAGQAAQGVQIMTIHQSKGLEFPIVAVPDMDISNRKPSFPYMMDGKHGVISKRYREEVYEERQESEKDMESAERRRLYYVALTRARDFLILGKDSSDKESKLDEVFEHACKETAYEGEKQIIASIPELHPKSRLKDVLGELQRDGGQIERLAALWNRAAPYAADPALLGTFSVTLLEDFLECERRYHLKHLLERSTTLWMEPGKRDDEQSNRGASLGLLVHSFMEVWPLDKLASLEDVLDFFQAATKHTLSSAENAAARSLSDFMAGPFMSDLRQEVARGEQVMQELPFISRIEWPDGKSMRLKGRVDLLLVPSEGALKLVDFKYARFDKSRHKRYALQVAAYAAALGKAWGERKIDCTIAYLSGSPQMVEVDVSGVEGEELLGHFENIVREAHSRSHLPFDRWRRCPESSCQNSHCRFSKLCGID